MGTTVLAMPTRNPIVLAREVATLDALSGGRVILGVGTGWIREELEAVGVAWAERGRFLDEGIRVLRLLWSEEGPISFSGRYTNFREMLFEPKPARRGGPPIWVGGMTHPSLRRVARMADGWLPWAVSKEELGESAAAEKSHLPASVRRISERSRSRHTSERSASATTSSREAPTRWLARSRAFERAGSSISPCPFVTSVSSRMKTRICCCSRCGSSPERSCLRFAPEPILSGAWHGRTGGYNAASAGVAARCARATRAGPPPDCEGRHERALRSAAVWARSTQRRTVLAVTWKDRQPEDSA